MEDLQILERIQWNPVLPLAPQTGNSEPPALTLRICPVKSRMQNLFWEFRTTRPCSQELPAAGAQGWISMPSSALQEGDAFLPGSTAWDKHSPEVSVLSEKLNKL